MSPAGYTKVPLTEIDLNDDIEAQVKPTQQYTLFKEIYKFVLHLVELLSWLSLVSLTYYLYDTYMTLSLNVLQKICTVTGDFSDGTCSYVEQYPKTNVYVFIYGLMIFGLLSFNEIYHPSEWGIKYRNPLNSFCLVLLFYMIYINYLIYSDYLDLKIINDKITYSLSTISELETYSHNIQTDRNTNHISLAFPGQLIMLTILISLIICIFKTCGDTCKSFRRY